MVRIRLRRVGGKRQPSYRIVVTDSRSPRDGRFIEKIGFYNPRTSPDTLEVDEARALHWLTSGAQPSDAVARILRSLGTWGRYERLKAGEDLEKLLGEAEKEVTARGTTDPRTRRDDIPVTPKKKVEEPKEAAKAAAPAVEAEAPAAEVAVEEPAVEVEEAPAAEAEVEAPAAEVEEVPAVEAEAPTVEAEEAPAAEAEVEAPAAELEEVPAAEAEAPAVEAEEAPAVEAEAEVEAPPAAPKKTRKKKAKTEETAEADSE
jgi:small subunit ribosomal protein S16